MERDKRVGKENEGVQGKANEGVEGSRGVPVEGHTCTSTSMHHSFWREAVWRVGSCMRLAAVTDLLCCEPETHPTPTLLCPYYTDSPLSLKIKNMLKHLIRL